MEQTVPTNTLSAPTETRRPAAPRRSKADRRAIAEAWSASGVSAKDFAAQRGVTASSLLRWRQELSRPARRKRTTGGFVEVNLEPRAATAEAAPATIEVVIGEHGVRVAPGFDDATLARVVRVLRNVAAP